MLNIDSGRRDLSVTPAGQVVPAPGDEGAPVTRTLGLQPTGRPRVGVRP